MESKKSIMVLDNSNSQEVSDNLDIRMSLEDPELCYLVHKDDD